MVIKYIGRKHYLKGKPLWEILGNLKNHGVGRMIIRNTQQRYPEACYMKILKVAALPDTSKHFHDPRNVVVLVEQVFRGKKLPLPVQIDTVTFKPDYMLIPKDQEANYINRTKQPIQKIMPRTTNFPPLLKEILMRQKNLKEESSDLKLTIKYAPLGIKNYKIAEEGETPTVNIEIGLGEPASPSLYANIKQENTS
ncbi:hypothetical protein HZU73_09944 [Apis mellifera caucasica]|uniref:Uncharacterized protein LOC408493 n=1 Tax=Apis mellifera TaxID=7460 RepID=A0A7M7R2Q4_APIME|nr:uncharacterized protein LOC408493 [Apis mellifera]KAG6794380.1 hypothetical protein HZU73_09944 [Apis mellifera caucasica]|eukprot:XP_392037.1 uncharacterized protein LOC408493 [Apis mellifera]